MGVPIAIRYFDRMREIGGTTLANLILRSKRVGVHARKMHGYE
jgi:hypothetical protein